MKYVSHSLKDTQEFAKKFASNLKAGDVVLLFGQMGGGKTTFSKAVIKSLGFEGVVTSPTFALVNVYEAKFTVQHFDMYRLENISEAFEVGLDEMLKSKTALSLVEWPEKAKEILPKNALKVFVRVVDENTREFEVEGMNELS